jgi:hypothetical protein
VLWDRQTGQIVSNNFPDITISEDQVPRLQAFRAEHPDIETASPAGSRTGMWSAYQGGKILVVTFGLRQLLDRLDELLASD